MPPLGAWAFRYLCGKYADILCSVQGHNVDTLRLEAIHRLLDAKPTPKPTALTAVLADLRAEELPQCAAT